MAMREARAKAQVRVARWLPLMLGLAACGGSELSPTDGGATDGGMMEMDAQVPIIQNPALVQTLAPEVVRAGEAIEVRCQILDDDGETFSSAGYTPQIRISPEDSVRRTGEGIIAARTGEVEISCSFAELMLVDESPAITEIIAGPPAEVVTEVDTHSVEAGGAVSATCTIFDDYGNEVDPADLVDATPELRVSPSEEGNSVEGLTATLTRAGIYDVACELTGASSDGQRVEVLPAAPANIVLATSPMADVYAQGQVIQVVPLVTDIYGNEIPDAPIVHDASPMSSGMLGAARFRFDEDGEYTIAATVQPPTHEDTPLSASVMVVVNGDGPSIQCGGPLGGPADAAMIDMRPGDPLTVTGTVADASGVMGVTINGSPATLDAAGNFSGDITSRFGMNFVDIQATDEFGTESSRTCTFLVSNVWHDPASIMNGAVSLKLTDEAIDDGSSSGPIDSLNDLLERALGSTGLAQTLGAQLAAANPLKNSCDVDTFLGCAFRSRVDFVNGSSMNGVRIRGANTDLSLLNGGFRADIFISSVDVRLRARASLGIDTTGDVHAEDVRVQVDFDLAIRGGVPTVSVRRVGTVSIGDISSDFSGIDGLVIDAVFFIASGFISDLIEDELRSFVTTDFDSILDGLFEGLDIDALGTSFAVPRLDGSGDITLNFGVGFSSVETTPSRMLVGLGTRFTLGGAPSVAIPSLGVALPPNSALLREPSGTMPAGVAVHVGIFNHALHALWRGGLFDATIGGAGLDGSLPDGLQAEVSAALPPVAVMTTEGDVELGLGGLTVRLLYPGLFPEPITLNLGALARTNVTLVDGDLVFDGVTVTEVFFSTEEVSLTMETRDALESFFRSLVQSLVDSALNDALPALPIPSFALPASLSSYGIPAVELGLMSPTLMNEPQHFVLRSAFGEI